MRPWRNRQTRTFEGRVGDRTGSSPVGRTRKQTMESDRFHGFFFTRKNEKFYPKSYNHSWYE